MSAALLFTELVRGVLPPFSSQLPPPPFTFYLLMFCGQFYENGYQLEKGI